MHPADPAAEAAARRREFLRLAYWLLPPLVCLVIYYHGLRAWYQQDDFVWLAQRFRVHNFHDFLRAVFGPSQHGTFRPLSERLFLLAAGTFFGADAFPARACVFLTQACNLILLSSITRRISGSRVAGLLAPILWIVNGAFAFPMAWSSAYMQILCGFCILLAFHFFLRYMETGRRTDYLWQWAVFLAGFGVMETMVVYPAIVAAYTLLCARKYFKSTWPLFGASFLFVLLDMLLVPKQRAGTYSLHFGAGMLHTLVTYWKWVLMPQDWLAWLLGPPWMVPAERWLLTAALVAYVAFATWRRNFLPLFGLAVFAVLLAPVLPLAEHISYYYLTLPALGIALVGAFAAASAARGRWWNKLAATALLALFAWVQAPYAYHACKWWSDRSLHIRDVVLGVVAVRQAMPDKTIVLTNVDDAIVSGAFWDGAFRAFGVSGVYADPAERANSAPDPDLEGQVSRFIDPADLRHALLDHSAEVLSLAGPVMLDVTPRFESVAQSPSSEVFPHRVDAGAALAKWYLRGNWYPLEAGHRWMGKTAGVVLAGPDSPSQKLHLSGYCTAAQVAAGPLTARVTVDGRFVGGLRLTQGDAGFEAALPLPQETIGKPLIEVMLVVSRTFSVPGDNRDLALSFGSFEIR